MNGVSTVQALIDALAETLPDRVFLISPETARELTFGELRHKTQCIVQALLAMGLTPQDKIAFMMDNGLCAVQLFLAAMYGGFVAVPLNMRSGLSQLAYSLNHSQAKLVFVATKYAGMFEALKPSLSSDVAIVSVDLDQDWPSNPPRPGPSVPLVAAEHAAMLIYTSGSTGQPKGPIHTHQSILAHGRNSIAAHRLTAADRSLLVLPLYHINAECVTVLPTLMSGGSIVVPHVFSAAEYWGWLTEYRCTWSAVVPTIISQLLDGTESPLPVHGLEQLRFIRSSSGPLSPALQREFIGRFGLPLIQAMGSSETGNIFSNPAPPGENKIGSPGLPWGFEIKIVDSAGAELPTGTPGEILLRGDGMMQGYYGDAAGTATVLDREGWLHTGDLAYRDEDGYVFIVGRSKELIIKAGMNIAPKQVDETLEAHPAVLEAAAVGIPDRYLGEDLVAYTVLRNGMAVDEKALLAFCEGQLGYFKTPTRIYQVADLPKGPSGKVQRLYLVEDAQRRAAEETLRQNTRASEGGADAESGALSHRALERSRQMEGIIAELWKQLLGPIELRRESNFFSCGGQSLQAIQCISQLRDRISVLLSLTDFFENPTLGQLSALLGRRQALQETMPESEDLSRALSTEHGLSKRERTGPARLSPAQERIWFMEQFRTGEPMYNEAEAVRLKGKLDVPALERAINAVVARHEILRTTIALQNEFPVAIVHESWPLKITLISLTAVKEEEREAALDALLISEPRLPYQMENEPGIRVSLVELSDIDHALILMMHHIVCDSSSIGQLWRELSIFYESELQGRPAILPPLPVQYSDYADWQRERPIDDDLEFWKHRLRDAPSLLDQPSDRPRPAVCSFRGNRKLFSFDGALTEMLRQFCREQQTTLFVVFAAALNTLMFRYSMQEDILLGIPIADREIKDLAPLIGFLLDTQALRVRMNGNTSFAQLLTDVRQGMLELYAHRAPPFDKVVAALAPQRTLSHSPVFQVMLNWRNREDQPQFLGFPGVVLEPLLAHSQTSKFDLTIVLTDTGGCVLAEVEFSTDLFDESRIARMIGHLHVILNAVVINHDQKLIELPLLTAEERQLLLSDWPQDEEDDGYS